MVIVFGVGCADPLYRRAVRVSMGHALLVPYAWSGELAGGSRRPCGTTVFGCWR